MTANQFLARHIEPNTFALTHEWELLAAPMAGHILRVYWSAFAFTPPASLWRASLDLPRNVRVILYRRVRLLGRQVTIYRHYLRMNADGEFELVGEWCFRY